MPSGAELSSRLKVETADIRAHHRDTEQVVLEEAVN